RPLPGRRPQLQIHTSQKSSRSLPLVGMRPAYVRVSLAATKTAAPLIPSRPTIAKLQTVASGCKACHLWKMATQTVFGEGKQTSTVMFIGEQPGNSEDLEGRPFVGPAGGLLDKALEEAGIDRTKVYVTNVV